MDGPFQIDDGVRRAYLYAAAGHSRVDAIVDTGHGLVRRRVLIADLRSPKLVIELYKARDVARYQSVARAVQQGVPLPPIEVSKPAKGIPLSQVRLET